jgi:nitrite reductase/ring-hydroxylating ferredoxin subunit
VHALADRCSHRGGPLSDGELDGDCVTCPWHGSTFSVTDGEVVSGPATIPQPTYEVRLEGSDVLVRRAEERSLRANPV